jgi:leucyl aminopeptidase
LGTSLIGFGILPQLNGVPNKVLTYMAFTGFCLSALGKALTALFAADASEVKQLAEQLVVNTSAIETKVSK